MLSKLFLTLVLMLSLDSIYLYVIKDAFLKQIVTIQRDPFEMNIVGVIVCYIALTYGLYHLVLKNNKSVGEAFLLGLVIYAVYESTSLALFKKWSPKLATIDTLWGGCLFALTTIGVKYLTR